MPYLRLDPQDYETISRLCRSQSLAERPLPAFRQLLLLGLADRFPSLAEAIAGLGRQQLQLLYGHFRTRPYADRKHGLTDSEVESVIVAAVPLRSRARFARQFKRALVGRLAESQAALAAKVDQLSLDQFEALCEEVQVRGRGES
jgi:hypothetical protein